MDDAIRSIKQEIIALKADYIRELDGLLVRVNNLERSESSVTAQRPPEAAIVSEIEAQDSQQNATDALAPGSSADDYDPW